MALNVGGLAANNWIKGVFTKIGNIQRIRTAGFRASLPRPFSSSHQMRVRLANRKVSTYRHEMHLTKADQMKHPARVANADILFAKNQFRGPGIIDGLEQKWHRHQLLAEESGTFGFSESRIDFWNRMSVDKRGELLESLEIVLQTLNCSRHPIFRSLPFVDEQGRNYLDKLGASVHTIQNVFDLGGKTGEVFPWLMINPQLFRNDMKLFAILAALCESYPVYWSQEVWYF